MYINYIKPLIDKVITIILIIVLSPIFLGISLVVKFTSEGPILFKRQVFGKHGKTFTLLKFRTMIKDAHNLLLDSDELKRDYNLNGKVENDTRITDVGKFLRKYSLDELPQLFHVLRGEMSLIGPRVLGDVELEWYGRYHDKVLTIRPGLSGLAQVMGRSKISINKRIAYDLLYIRKKSFLIDLKILLLTLYVVITGNGAK